MHILRRKKKNSCDRCGLTHQDGPLYVCMKCSAVLCENQLEVKVDLGEDNLHRLTDGSPCGPCVPVIEQEEQKQGAEVTSLNVYRIDADGKRKILLYTAAFVPQAGDVQVGLNIRDGSGHSIHQLGPLVFKVGEKLEVGFGDISQKEKDECQEGSN